MRVQPDFFSELPTAPRGPKTPRAPAGLTNDARDDLFHKMWEAGVPHGALIVVWGLTSDGQIWLWRQRMAARGLVTVNRWPGWSPPWDWRRCLDDILKKAEK